jgi:hypothetical protein
MKQPILPTSFLKKSLSAMLSSQCWQFRLFDEQPQGCYSNLNGAKKTKFSVLKLAVMSNDHLYRA